VHAAQGSSEMNITEGAGSDCISKYTAFYLTGKQTAWLLHFYAQMPKYTHICM
jgi:hypothetical protein